MKIAIDSRSASLHSGSGIGTYTKNLVSNLMDNIHDEFEIIWTGNYDSLLPKGKNTKIHLASGKNNSFFELNYIPNLLVRENVDLFHIPQNGIGFPFNYDLNVVVTIHDLIPYVLPETVGKGYLERFLKEMPNIIDRSKGIITVSEYSKKDILRFFPNYPADKIFVTPLAANENFKPLNKNNCKKFIKEKYKINDPFCLYLGGFSARKNVKELILSFEKIKNDLNKNYKLIICGALKDEGLSLKDYVISKGLSNDIIFIGYIDDSILPIFYNGCELFIYPSLYEGFGLPPLEAMKCKCPVITSNITSIPEVTEDSVMLIDPTNIDELSESIRNLLKDDLLRNDLAERGFYRSLNFSWENTSILTLDAYKKIINS